MNQIIKKETINICFASNDNYAPHLAVTILSLLECLDRTRGADILILHKDISAANQEKIHKIAERFRGVSIRFIDAGSYDERLSTEVGAYYSVETNYRLLLFSELFRDYDRLLYLDCDIVVTGDVSRLYDTQLNGKAVAAVRDEGLRSLSKSKRAVFFEDYPYNIDNYRSDALGMRHPKDYFNAGVVLFDLQKARQKADLEKVVRLLHSHNYIYNDQDVLNILFDSDVYLLDLCWNYFASIERQLLKSELLRELYADCKRENYQIIHYISDTKPWNADIPLGEYYHNMKKRMEEICDEEH